VDRPELQKH